MLDLRLLNGDCRISPRSSLGHTIKNKANKLTKYYTTFSIIIMICFSFMYFNIHNTRGEKECKFYVHQGEDFKNNQTIKQFKPIEGK